MKRNALFAAFAALTLAGCATFDQVDRTARSIDQSQKTASQIAEAARSVKQAPARDTVVFSQDNWVATTPIEIRKQNIPDALRCEILINAEKVPIDILEFSQVITRWCQIPARVTPDAMQAIQNQGRLVMGSASGATSQPVMPAGMPMAGMPMAGAQLPPLPVLPNNTTSSYGSAGIGGRAGMIDFKYQGELKPVLDMATQRLGISWKFVDGGISFFYLDTQIFNFAALALSTDFSSSVQSGMTTTSGASGGTTTGGSSGITGNSGSQQSATVSMKTSQWDDVEKAIRSMLTPGIGRVSVSPSSGTITVTDTFEVLGRVSSFLNGENKTLTKQILFNVKVLSVSITDTDGMGIDWNLVYSSLSGNYGFLLKNITTANAGATSFTANVLATATGNAQKFAGSSAVINALAQQGRVSTLRSPSLTTLNKHPVSIQIGSQVSYVAQSQTTNTAQVGSTTSLTPGTVTTGFNMILVPYVLPDNTMMLLESSINISALNRIRTVTSAGTTIEVPEVNNQILPQTSRLRPGETLILSGFEQMSEQADKSGVGTPNNILLGGSVRSNVVRDVIVVLITPIIMD